MHQLDELNCFKAIAFELYSSVARALGFNPRVVSSSLTIGILIANFSTGSKNSGRTNVLIG